MSMEIVKSFDPQNDSIGNLMAIVFPKSTSFNYPLAVRVAQGANGYAEKIIENKLFHMAVFSITQDGVNKALALLNYLLGLKGWSVFMNGSSYKKPYSVYEILQCYANAINCNDYRAYCQKVIKDPFIETYSSYGNLSFSIQLIDKQPDEGKPKVINKYLFPCKHLQPLFSFQKGHPATPQDQIQAAGIEHNCEWCPYFHPDEFVKLPTTVIWPDGSVMTEPN